MAISDTSLRSSIFLEIKGLIEGSALKYYDNSGTLRTGVTVTGAYIDDEQSFPQVVVNPANVGKDNYSFNRANYTNEIDVMIDLWDTRSRNIDYLSDQIDNISDLKNIQGLMLVDWTEARAYSTENESKIHSKTITMTFKRR